MVRVRVRVRVTFRPRMAMARGSARCLNLLASAGIAAYRILART